MKEILENKLIKLKIFLANEEASLANGTFFTGKYYDYRGTCETISRLEVQIELIKHLIFIIEGKI